jgi:hypothetical protein
MSVKMIIAEYPERPQEAIVAKIHKAADEVIDLTPRSKRSTPSRISA